MTKTNKTVSVTLVEDGSEHELDAGGKRTGKSKPATIPAPKTEKPARTIAAAKATAAKAHAAIAHVPTAKAAKPVLAAEPKARKARAPKDGGHPGGRGKRHEVAGVGACELVRWMAKHGFDFATARRVLDALEGGKGIADATIKTQLTRKGSPAELTKEMADRLVSLRNAAREAVKEVA